MFRQTPLTVLFLLSLLTISTSGAALIKRTVLESPDHPTIPLPSPLPSPPTDNNISTSIFCEADPTKNAPSGMVFRLADFLGTPENAEKIYTNTAPGLCTLQVYEDAFSVSAKLYLCSEENGEDAGVEGKQLAQLIQPMFQKCRTYNFGATAAVADGVWVYVRN
ncbi:MAG: hypothetical protein M1831_001567 [Alyxoria varia]|nr:MAG: hypothetical protein M1831_001567 [Alyxoria varia]